MLDFVYDESGRPFALKYSTDGGSTFTTYYYVLNLQGDVVKLVEHTRTGKVYNLATVANYTYNAWGEILSITDANGTAITDTTHIFHINPLRYRGYYYDTETGFYYLQSRYYDPTMHRFINADSLASTGQGIAGTNMFAYCGNNPIICVDSEGKFYTLTIDEIEKIRAEIRKAAAAALVHRKEKYSQNTWATNDANGRFNLLCDYVYDLSKILQIDTAPKVGWFDGEVGSTIAQYRNEENLLLLNDEIMYQGSYEGAYEAVAHEMFHAYQHYVVDQRPGWEDTGTVKAWKDFFDNRIDPRENYYGYWYSATEVSAREFASRLFWRK